MRFRERLKGCSRFQESRRAQVVPSRDNAAQALPASHPSRIPPPARPHPGGPGEALSWLQPRLGVGQAGRSRVWQRVTVPLHGRWVRGRPWVPRPGPGDAACALRGTGQDRAEPCRAELECALPVRSGRCLWMPAHAGRSVPVGRCQSGRCRSVPRQRVDASPVRFGPCHAGRSVPAGAVPVRPVRCRWVPRGCAALRWDRTRGRRRGRPR